MSKLYGDVTGKSGWPPIKKPKRASRDKKIAELKALVTELCDALEKYGPIVRQGTGPLIQRAKEAIK